MTYEVKAASVKDVVHLPNVSLYRLDVSNGVSVGVSRVTVDFEKGLLRVGNPFSRLTRVMSLSDYDDFDGDMLEFVSDVLSDRR